MILFAGFVLMCAAIYYLDGVMSLLLKLGENFHLVAIWVVGGFAVAWMVSYVVRAWMHYKTKQMEAEYAFRHEVLERTGMVILDTKHAPTTELRMLPRSPAASQEPCHPPWMWTPQPRFRPPKRVRRIPPKRPWMVGSEKK